MESYHGTEYANRLVYKSLPFMLIQFCMFLSILFATFIRLPPKKHLYGFYVIHAGLITVFIGSFITYQSGVDGSVTLAPNMPARQIQLSDDELQIELPSAGKEVSVAMPFVPGPTDLRFEYEGIKVKKFLPFAENTLTWLPTKIVDEKQTSSRYRLQNQNFGEFLTLSLHPQSDFNNTMKLGPLNVHYMPATLGECFTQNTKSGLIVWNGEQGSCISPEDKDFTFKKIGDKKVASVNFENQILSFFPELSPLPLDNSGNMSENSPYRIFSKKLFEKSPHLFLFGQKVAYFEKDKEAWSGKDIKVGETAELPWMGFRVTLLEHRNDAFPMQIPTYVKPIQDGGQMVAGEMKALLIDVDGQEFWLRSGEPVSFNRKGERVSFVLGKKSLQLPYELILDRFKMDTDPGTATPASFESFVTLFNGNKGSTKHHIFMNNPLKHENFTFYQASYFQTQEGPYGSVLSVNFDPGRFWKYLGSLLLVLGSIWHYLLRRKNMIKKPGAPA